LKSQKVKFEYLENKLIAKICAEKPHPFTLGELYPQVKSIGGNKISPDIDILQRIDTHNLVVGYEIKWLHYFKKNWHVMVSLLSRHWSSSMLFPSWGYTRLLGLGMG